MKQFDDVEVLKENELVLNQADTKEIMEAVEIAKNVKLPNISDLKIKLETKIVTTDEQERAIKEFREVLNNLPKSLDVDVLMNGKESKGDYLKLNMKQFILDMVEDHFKDSEEIMKKFNLNEDGHLTVDKKARGWYLK